MLRENFGEPRRTDTGLYLETRLAIESFRGLLRERMEADPGSCSVYTRFDVWTRGFLTALNELEQSCYCARRYRSLVDKRYTEAMDERELDQYHRYLYYFKNAFIRVFAVLDKLGHFMNEYFGLRTEKVKHRFSYFTVLRRMSELGRESRLERKLTELKQQYREPLQALRQKRNMEVHWFNSEMLDDLERAHLCSWDRTYVENLDENIADLDRCFTMVCQSVSHAFDHAGRALRKR